MATRDPLGNLSIKELIAAGQAAFEDSRFEEATDHFRAALRIKPLSAEEEAVIRCQLSEALEKRGFHRQLFDEIFKYGNPSEFARLSEHTQMLVLVRLGWAYSYNNDIPSAIAFFNQAMHIARCLDNYTGIGACYLGLGRAYRYFSENRIARDHYTSALEYFRHIGNWRETAECYFSIGNIDTRESEYKTALLSFRQALSIMGDNNDHELLGRVYGDMALIHIHLEISTTKAIDALEKAIDHSLRDGNILYLALNYNNLALGMIWLGDWKRAERLLISAIEGLRQTSNIAYLVGSLDSLAQFYLLQGNLEAANLALNESLQTISTITNDKDPRPRNHVIESNIQTTIGRVFLAKRQFGQAISHLTRATDIAVRLGDQQYLSEARLWLAEALLQDSQIERAYDTVETVSSALRDKPDMMVWGLMTRMVAKVEDARGHTAAALQSLAQSSSFFEIRGSIYDRAVNRIVLAYIMEKQGAIAEAISETESAIAVFERLGAAIDERNSRAYLESLKNRHSTIREQSTLSASRSQHSEPDSMMDGFLAQRLAQASVSRELLLYELASIIRDQSAGRAALVAEVGENESKLAASVGLDEKEKTGEMEFLSRLPAEEYDHHFVYPFAANRESKLLLRIIAPQSERFKSGAVTLRPMLSLVEVGLEAHAHRSERRRVQAFDPARLLAQVEMPGFICASRAMSQVLEKIHKIRSSDVTVLITGESGTGKELIARAIHGGSARRFRTFLPFNCSSTPRDMIESQLFGYRKGAFTGATADYEGIIRAAERGSLLLDEIGDLPVDLQPKLLRFLQEGEIHPLGKSQPVQVDVRVIAATNRDLEQAIIAGKFREDLYHRLNVIRIHVPPLRERREEIPALLTHYLDIYQQEAAKTGMKLSEEAVDLMVVYDWPGNVRELCNEVRRIVAYGESGTVVTAEALSAEIARAGRQLTSHERGAEKIAEPLLVSSTDKTLAVATSELERRMIQEALRRSSGNITQAARELGLTRRGLYMKMDRLKFNE